MELTAADGHRLHAYRADPPGAARGGLVLLHEIFGANAHIREVCDGFARDGFVAIAPALFDRVERDVELAYDAAGIERGRTLRTQIGWDASLADVQAAIDAAGAAGPVAVVGYCWGGTLAFLAATRLSGLACAVSYYGGQTTPFAAETPRVPVLMHFGDLDPRILPADIAAVATRHPDIPIHRYPADHGFNCDHRKEWHEPSARLARTRTLAFIDQAFAATAAPGA